MSSLKMEDLKSGRYVSKSMELPRVASNEQLEAILTGKLTIYWETGGFDIIGKLSKSQRDEYEKAKKRGFVCVDDSLVSDAYFYWCEVNRRPYITIKNRRKYASVDIDHITIGRKKIKKIGDKAFPIIKEYNLEPPLSHTWANKVPIEKAEELAAKLFVVCYSVLQGVEIKNQSESE